MKPYLSFLVILFIPFLVINKKYKALFILMMISVVCSSFSIAFLGTSRILMGAFIGLLSLPFMLPFLKHSLLLKKFSLPRALLTEYFFLIVLAFYFIFIGSLEGTDLKREVFSASLKGRSILGSVRILGDCSITFFIIYLFWRRVITLEYFVKVVFIITVVHTGIAIFDFLTNFPIKRVLVVESDFYRGRPSGLTHEPKQLGRLMFGSFLLFFSLSFDKDKLVKVPKFALLISLIGLLVSFSVSAYLAAALSISIVTLLTLSLNNMKKILLFGLVLAIAFGIFSKTTMYQEIFLRKIDFYVGLVESDKRKDEPSLFCYLEVFDRSAAYFFSKNPQYIYTGVGPNLVSIPSSNYISPYFAQMWKYQINGLPSTVIYYFSRSGIIGLLIFFSIFFKLRKRIRKLGYAPFNYLLIGIFVFTALNNQIWFYIYMGLIYGVVTYAPEQIIPKNKTNQINS